MIPYEGLYVVYFVSAIFFILAIRGLSSPKTAREGNYLGMLGMSIAVLSTLLILPSKNDFGILIALVFAAVLGIVWANRVKLTALPQMIALLNAFGGGASILVGVAQIFRKNVYETDVLLGIMIGSLALSGSMIAFLKLDGRLNIKFLPARHMFVFMSALFLAFCFANLVLIGSKTGFYLFLFSSLLCGMLITLPIGGADMPIVISFLNACAGFAASGIGFSLYNVALIMTGAIVGISGLILALVMTKAMNRSLRDVFLKDMQDKEETNQAKTGVVHVGSPQDAAFLMENASKVIIVPGYGMAVADAGNALKNLASVLELKYHVDVKFAIHPVAGRMPGHMNVLLAEAKVDYEKMFSLEDINADFETADVAYVIGANDIVNPIAKTDLSSPLYGMPILEAQKAKTVFMVKRSLASGYSGAQNPLFYADNTLMLFGDAKKVTEEIVAAL